MEKININQNEALEKNIEKKNSKANELIEKLYNGAYLERFGAKIKPAIEYLMQESEKPLNEEQKAEIKDFETELLDFELSSGLTIKQSLEQKFPDSKEAPSVFVEPFLKKQLDFEELKGQEFNSAEDFYQWYAEQINNGDLDKKRALEIAKASQEYYENVVAEKIVNDEEIESELTENHQFVLDSEKLLKQMLNLNEAREYIKGIQEDLRENDDLISEAKKSYSKIVNNMIFNKIADRNPKAVVLLEQLKLSDNQESEQKIAEVESVTLPRIKQYFEQDRKDEILEMLDFYRNGAGRSEKMNKVFSKLHPDLKSQASLVNSETKLSEQETKQLRLIKFTPEKTKQFFEQVIERAGLSRDQVGDNGISVIIDKSKDTMSVDSNNLDDIKIKVGKSNRSLEDIITVGLAHEFEHANQALARKKATESLRLFGLTGRRTSGLKEAGALRSENKARFEFFGATKARANTYGEALKALEETDNIGEAIKAFYQEKITYFPDMNRKKAAKEAANRLIRFMRFGGQNSQPLSYPEALIMEDTLADCDQNNQKRATILTSLNIADQVRLHQFGLLPKELGQEQTNWLEIGLKELKEEIHLNY